MEVCGEIINNRLLSRVTDQSRPVIELDCNVAVHFQLHMC